MKIVVTRIVSCHTCGDQWLERDGDQRMMKCQKCGGGVVDSSRENVYEISIVCLPDCFVNGTIKISGNRMVLYFKEPIESEEQAK